MGKSRPPMATAAAAQAGSAKKRARGLERLLKRGGLPDDVRRAKEAELDTLRGKSQKVKRTERERDSSKEAPPLRFASLHGRSSLRVPTTLSTGAHEKFRRLVSSRIVIVPS